MRIPNFFRGRTDEKKGNDTLYVWAHGHVRACGLFSGDQIYYYLRLDVKTLGSLAADTKAETVRVLCSLHGYIKGVFDAQNGVLYRAPADVSYDHVKAALLDYIKKYPEARQQPVASILIAAFKEAFPSS